MKQRNPTQHEVTQREDYAMSALVNASLAQSASKNFVCLKMKKRHLKAVDFALSVLRQAHMDLSELCEVVCSENRPLSANVFEDLNHIQGEIDSVCTKTGRYTADSRFFEVFQECHLADSLLTCLIITIWTREKSPTQQPLEWSEAVVIFGVVFSTMDRLAKALNALKAVIV